jgi:DNA-binding NarL/FixJ family response regulator
VSPIRVLVADDHSVVREGIRHVLEAGGDFEVVAEAADGEEAIELARRHRPDVVLLDISMPRLTGLQAVGPLRRELPGSRILILSVHDDAQYVLECVRSGAHGYLRKDTSPAELRSALKAVHSGGEWYSPDVARRLSEAIRNQPEAAPAPAAALAELTPREREVLERVARGLTNKETAGELGISTRTVEAHRDSITRKLGVRTTAGLTRLAIEAGLVRDS